MKYLVDIDGTICTNTFGDYQNAQPFVDRIEHFNNLFDQGHEIHYWTARGGNSGVDWTILTKQQFVNWQVKYTTLKLGKPTYDIWIDDKAVNSEVYYNENIINRT
jgi:hypothetical protein